MSIEIRVPAVVLILFILLDHTLTRTLPPTLIGFPALIPPSFLSIKVLVRVMYYLVNIEAALSSAPSDLNRGRTSLLPHSAVFSKFPIVQGVEPSIGFHSLQVGSQDALLLMHLGVDF